MLYVIKLGFEMLNAIFFDMFDKKCSYMFLFFVVVLLNLIFLLYSLVGWVDSHQMLVIYQSINSHITGSAAKI